MRLRQTLGYRLHVASQLLPTRLQEGSWRVWRALRPLPVQRLRGSNHAGATTSAIVIGHVASAGFLLDKFFASPPEATPLGKITPWRAAALWRAQQEELTVLVGDRVLGRRLPRRERLIVPTWVRAQAPVPSGRLAVSSKVQADIRRVRNAGLGCEVSAGPAEAREFLETMLRPHIEARYTVSHVALHEVQAALRKGEILWITEAGRRLGGAVVVYRGDTLSFRYAGILNGDPALLKRGVLAAAYLQMFTRAQQRGCQQVDLGGSRPWVTDGVLRFKMKWRAELTAQWHKPEAAFVRWVPGSVGVHAMLSRDAPIARERDAFYFVAASAAWPPVLVPVVAGDWPNEPAVAPPPAA